MVRSLIVKQASVRPFAELAGGLKGKKRAHRRLFTLLERPRLSCISSLPPFFLPQLALIIVAPIELAAGVLAALAPTPAAGVALLQLAQASASGQSEISLLFWRVSICAFSCCRLSFTWDSLHRTVMLRIHFSFPGTGSALGNVYVETLNRRRSHVET